MTAFDDFAALDLVFNGARYSSQLLIANDVLFGSAAFGHFVAIEPQLFFTFLLLKASPIGLLLHLRQISSQRFDLGLEGEALLIEVLLLALGFVLPQKRIASLPCFLR